MQRALCIASVHSTSLKSTRTKIWSNLLALSMRWTSWQTQHWTTSNLDLQVYITHENPMISCRADFQHSVGKRFIPVQLLHQKGMNTFVKSGIPPNTCRVLYFKDCYSLTQATGFHLVIPLMEKQSPPYAKPPANRWLNYNQSYRDGWFWLKGLWITSRLNYWDAKIKEGLFPFSSSFPQIRSFLFVYS